MDRLLTGDRGAEGGSLLGVGGRLLQRSLGEADRHCGDADPAPVEGGQEDTSPLAKRSQQGLVGHAAVVEDQLSGVRGVPAQLAVGLLGFIPQRAIGNDKSAEWGAAVDRRPGGDDDKGAQLVAGVGDKSLGAVDDPAAVFAAGACGRGANVGAAAWLGAGERAEMLAAGEGHEPALLLLLRAEEQDRFAGNRDVGADGDSDRGVDPRQLLDDDRHRHGAGPEATVLFGKGDAHRPQFAELADHVGWEVVGLVPLASVGGDLALGELADGVPEGALIVGQLEHLAGSHRRHPLGLRWLRSRLVAATGPVVYCPVPRHTGEAALLRG